MMRELSLKYLTNENIRGWKDEQRQMEMETRVRKTRRNREKDWRDGFIDPVEGGRR